MNTEINAGASSSTGPPTKFAIRYNPNIKSPDELKKFKSSPHEITEIDILKNQYRILHVDRTTQLNQLDLLENKKDNSDKEKNAVKRSMARVLTLETELTDIWQRLEELTKRKSMIDDDIITIPEFGKNSEIDFHGVQGIPTFDPKSSSPTLYQVWEQICEFSTNFELTEKAIKTIMSQKLQHEALDLFMLFKDRPLRNIMQHLKNRFGSFPSMLDYEVEYESFTRRKGEDISTAMARFEMILRKLHQQQSPKEIKQVIERDCKTMVKKIALPEARKQLDREEEKAKIKGCFFSYKDRLDTVLLEENLIMRQKTMPTINLGVIEDQPDYDVEENTPSKEYHEYENNYTPPEDEYIEQQSDPYEYSYPEEEDEEANTYREPYSYPEEEEEANAHLPFTIINNIFVDDGVKDPPTNHYESQDKQDQRSSITPDKNQTQDRIPEEPKENLFSFMYNDEDEDPPSINILKLIQDESDSD